MLFFYLYFDKLCNFSGRTRTSSETGTKTGKRTSAPNKLSLPTFIMTLQPTLHPDILEVIRRALTEDIGPGDATTDSIVPAEAMMQGRIIAKQDGIIAGLDVAQAVYRMVDAEVDFRAQVEGGFPG